MFFCLTFSIRSYFDGKIYNAVLAAIFGVIGAGGSLEVVGFGCAAYLVLLIVYAIGIRNIKNNIKRVIFLVLPFVFTVAGALFSTMAPGNFARHDVMEEGGKLEMVPSFISSWYNFISHIGGLLTAYLLPVILALVFVICLCSVSKVAVSGKMLTGGVVGAVFIVVVTIFPVILGYGSFNIDAYLSGARIIYTFDLVIVLAAIVVVSLLAFYIKDLLKRNNVPVREQAVKSVVLIVTVLLLFSGEVVKNYNNGMSMKIIDDLKNERIQIASAQMTEMYKKIDDAEDGSDVVLNEPVLPGTVLYIPLYIDYPDYFANAEVADYYNVNSFVQTWY